MTTKILVNNLERKLFWLLVGFLGLSFFLYFYFVISLTVAGVERDRVVSQMREMTTQASMLEQEYMHLQNSVTLAHASDLGFKEVTAKFSHTTHDKFSLAQ
ncbi:MAG: hypothetical protein A3B07_01505 [Candidatus Yonathbacteria bacterium RIFCSPLOWO2_01_FULL_43_27]|uniref:Cell division protein FtsL n=1 Tax=Candidatus Yonathbacteria bacterium RIFCSPLOWO2_01_FULL_43_27 TaxID=1802726 RepID=A0A1G2SC54_9BACT|nr:MAG: hypothetical protein A2658_01300 [Candidatus Yonathbacteria bacterium RIFCSPHIGHO2_01_FULL_44_19]OHA82590.1 MAG: hypothetical protein A3B07_01505 [Candidatus Yonathbacteria bacterium RIFCSPLOWO2_01_FULL_43_27]